MGLHSRRNLALYVTALLFVLAWATSGINGWFYVGNYGVPWFDRQPVILRQPVTTIFLVLAIATGLLAGWLHFRMDYRTRIRNIGRGDLVHDLGGRVAKHAFGADIENLNDAFGVGGDA